MKVVLLKASPWPLPRGLMRPTGTVLEVTESEAAVLRERGLIADEEQEEPAEVGELSEDAGDPNEHADEGEPEAQDSPEPPAPAPASAGGKKYPALPKKSASVNVWREYARSNDIDIRGLSDAAEIKGHIMKVVGGE